MAEKTINIVWSTVDVQQVRPDLTDEQAWEVLQGVEHELDADMGVNWDTLRMVADELFPVKGKS